MILFGSALKRSELVPSICDLVSNSFVNCIQAFVILFLNCIEAFAIFLLCTSINPKNALGFVYADILHSILSACV